MCREEQGRRIFDVTLSGRVGGSGSSVWNAGGTHGHVVENGKGQHAISHSVIRVRSIYLSKYSEYYLCILHNIS